MDKEGDKSAGMLCIHQKDGWRAGTNVSRKFHTLLYEYRYSIFQFMNTLPSVFDSGLAIFHNSCV